MPQLPRYVSQGQSIAAGWSNQSLLQAFTELIGTDGEYFLPVNDRGGYTPGVIRSLPTGGIFTVGLPVVRLTHPWLSDGQIETLMTYTGAVTLRHHISESVGKTDVQTSNCYFNLDMTQLTQLTRKGNGYRDFVSTFVIVEVL